jgi:hypothetical protein
VLGGVTTCESSSLSTVESSDEIVLFASVMASGVKVLSMIKVGLHFVVRWLTVSSRAKIDSFSLRLFPWALATFSFLNGQHTCSPVFQTLPKDFLASSVPL